jgi:hypothetical protein
MIRTQVYLTETEKEQLEAIAATRGVKQSELIRQAVDDMIDKYGTAQRLRVVQQARGVWKNRTDLPGLRNLREGWAKRTTR